MPRNGSGTFSLTATSVAPAVSGTLIESADFNTTIQEIADALTQSISKDGQTVITGDIDFDGNQLILDADGDTTITADTDDRIDFRIGGADLVTIDTGSMDLSLPIDENKGSDIASATTTDIGAATGNFVDITGTTTITSFGTVKAGTKRTLHFDSALTITYNATSMITLTGGDYKVAAGEVMEWTSLGSGNWQQTGMNPVAGTWTPAIHDTTHSDGEGQTYSAQYGLYTKVGNRVFIHGHLDISSVGTLSNETAYIGNLPFTSSSTSNSHGLVSFPQALNLSSTTPPYSGIIAPGTDYIALYETIGNGVAATTLNVVADVVATTSFRFFGEYVV